MTREGQQQAVTGLQVRIRVGGRIDAGWSSWFEGLAVHPLAGGDTGLRGIVADQASLHGLLSRIRDVGVPLLGVEVTDVADGELSDEASPSQPRSPAPCNQARSGPRPTGERR